jgi:membrane protein
MVAYYAVFSLPGLLLVAITITMYFMGQDVVEGKIYGQANELMEDEGAMKL